MIPTKYLYTKDKRKQMTFENNVDFIKSILQMERTQKTDSVESLLYIESRRQMENNTKTLFL